MIIEIDRTKTFFCALERVDVVCRGHSHYHVWQILEHVEVPAFVFPRIERDVWDAQRDIFRSFSVEMEKSVSVWGLEE